jgi:diguanylate cyclase (GGDEF)-like protein
MPPASTRGFEEELQRAERFDRPLSLIMLDLDHFKAVNDEYGHPTGDAVLAVLGQLIAGSMRAYDIAARIGGEEFAVELPEVGLDDATMFAERLRLKIADSRVTSAAGTAFSVTVSLGVATLATHGPTRAKMVAQADAALYAAKRAGRNQVAVAPTVPLPT